MAESKTPPLRIASFCLLLLLVIWIVIEGVSLVIFAAVNHASFSYPKVVAALAAQDNSGTPAVAITGHTSLNWNDYEEVLHPYFGFVADPNHNRPFWNVSDFGFIFNGKTSEITHRSPGRLVVAVFGGSFANGVFAEVNVLFHAKAAALGKEVEVINFSSAGYKQPQQLMVLSYMLALGAQFDVVVNVDGFNDIVLPVVENVPNHVNPFFPRSWQSRTAETISQENVRRIGYIEYLKDRRAGRARAMLKSRLYLSPTLSLLWQWSDQAKSRAIYATQEQIARDGTKAMSYTMQGPKYAYAGEPQLLHDLAEVWKNSSEEMNALCAARGTRYYHFLQPNQYVPNSKPMTAAEEKVARTKVNPFRDVVVAGYPYLFKAGAELKRDGVDFTDLTQLFAHDSRPMYVDDCCHVNGIGYDLVAARIYAEIYPDQKSE